MTGISMWKFPQKLHESISSNKKMCQGNKIQDSHIKSSLCLKNCNEQTEIDQYPKM